MFGVEFAAMKSGIETLRGTWFAISYKLRMMSVPIRWSKYVFGDHMFLSGVYPEEEGSG